MRSIICFLLALLLTGPAMLIQAQPSGELVIALPNDPTSLYIANASDVTAISATRQLYDGLVWLDSEGTLRPGLAESREVNEEATQYTFHLRQGVTFHNGEALPRIEGAHCPGLYFNSWVDDTTTAYVDRLNTAIDRDERAAVYREVSRYLFNNPPFVYLYALNIFEATTSRVTGYKPLATETWYLNEVGVDGWSRNA